MSSETQTRNLTVSVPQSINYKNVPRFAFLSKPPSLHNRIGPNISLPPPPPPTSPAYSNIIAWASLVQPGSPAPRSPHRRPSVSSSRRSSFSRLNRRPSISHARAASGSLIHFIDTQKTPSVGDFDLTALGYTSVFVHLPKTPTTPSPYLRQRSGTTVDIPPISKPPSPKSTYAHIPIPPMPSEEPPVKRTGLSRFRSLSVLRPRSSKSKQHQQPSVTPSPTATAPISKFKKHPAPTESHPSTIAKRKRVKYSIPKPPPLANDLALMQFLDGGNIDSHAQRVMQAQAKAAAGSGAGVGVGDVYRDGNGGIWWDADEELEYTHLLADTGPATAHISKTNDAMAMDWEHFTTEPSYLEANKENERRDSVSSQDSDLDPKYLVTVPELSLIGGINAPVEDRVLASHKIGGPGMSILSLPSRPRRKALHLNKADFLVDMAAFGPRSPKSSVAATQSAKPRPKGQARRRPAPLKLAHQGQNATVVVRRPGQIKSVEKVRKEFIADSFAPVPASAATKAIPRSVTAPQAIKTKPSRMNMRGIFGRKTN